jgi:hypothetical protein
MYAKLPTDSVDIPVHIFAIDTQAHDPQAFFEFAEKIVCHELCYSKMTALLA